MEEQQAVFNIEKIYLKDASFEAPNAPGVFMATEVPTVDVSLSTQSQPMEGFDGLLEVVLTVGVTAKGEDKAYFMVEVQQAGLFRIQNVPDEHMPVLLGVHCPNILFPFAREAIADLIGKGGFQPLHLNPINFEALFQAGAEQQPQVTAQ